MNDHRILVIGGAGYVDRTLRDLPCWLDLTLRSLTICPQAIQRP